jgi:hypothetical protein
MLQWPLDKGYNITNSYMVDDYNWIRKADCRTNLQAHVQNHLMY